MKPNLNDLKIYSEFAVATTGNEDQIIKEGEQWDALLSLYEEILDSYKPDNPTEVNDPSIEWDGDRWRCQVFNSAYGWGCALRRNPSKIPHLVDDLKFSPDEILALAKGTGLVLIAGPTGGGKSTTMASILDYLSQTQSLGQTVTIEEPIEYMHTNPLITQREVGVTVSGFFEGVHEAMRQFPKNIVIGEIRHPDTAEAAVQAGLTGHRVFATLHAENIADVITRMFALLDDQHDQLFPQALQGIICQHLVHGVNGTTYCLYESIKVTQQVRSILTEGTTALPRLNHEMYQQKRKTLSEFAQKLVISGQLLPEEVIRWSKN